MSTVCKPPITASPDEPRVARVELSGISRVAKNFAKPTYAERPEFDAPRAANRMRQQWASCASCQRWFATPIFDPRRCCSWRCAGDHARATGRFAGAANPRWLGGIATAPGANMRYKRRADAKHPTHLAARRAVHNAVRTGRLIRQPCEVCGDPKSTGHHDDYSKPLDVRWLCRTHHDEHHANERRNSPTRKATP